MESQPNSPTEKFQEKLKEEKNTRDELLASVQSKEAGIQTLIQFAVYVAQISIIFVGYTILSNHFSYLEKFNYWEFGAITLGAFSILTFVRNYIKDIKNSK